MPKYIVIFRELATGTMPIDSIIGPFEGEEAKRKAEDFCGNNRDMRPMGSKREVWEGSYRFEQARIIACIPPEKFLNNKG